MVENNRGQQMEHDENLKTEFSSIHNLGNECREHPQWMAVCLKIKCNTEQKTFHNSFNNGIVCLHPFASPSSARGEWRLSINIIVFRYRPQMRRGFSVRVC